MEIQLIFVFLSTLSLVAGNFDFCYMLHYNAQMCKPANSSVLMNIYRGRVNESVILINNSSHIDVEMYPDSTVNRSTYGMMTFTEDSFKDLQKLRSIRLSVVEFQGTPSPFVNLQFLESIAFRDNNLSEFPREFFRGIPHLKTISVYDQEIRNLPKNSLDEVGDHLENLELKKLQLESIEPGAFSRLSHLKNLILDDNQLQALGPEIFEGLGHLETLQVQKNQVKSIEPRTFDGSPRLRELNLEFNYLETLPDKIFHRLENLKTLLLYHNQIINKFYDLTAGLKNLTVWSFGEITKHTSELSVVDPPEIGSLIRIIYLMEKENPEM
ncbi:leucine-rich repeat-containing protein 15 isoform X1 [Fopius arisanus]|uniref:Leucine-rich repeat-containing protein 15 isoform X1 n=2 Tax=Fopius arisanus TaxID=64838 RepID=A0A9R1U360_9HYME|nr:PREDICTED: leucine-rich repeat-containing protein 15 isoform X1 [Fopius arisanus]XP_011306660.1 PREDICTED: leucine-rich repeat-containing protein 15 isoform X1 [Fopius arisanus]